MLLPLLLRLQAIAWRQVSTQASPSLSESTPLNLTRHTAIYMLRLVRYLIHLRLELDRKYCMLLVSMLRARIQCRYHATIAKRILGKLVLR